MSPKNWYRSNAVRVNQRVTTAQLVDRRLTPEQQEALLLVVLDETDGACHCCKGGSGSQTRPHLDWSPTQRDDTGGPLLRGALCRSCKIAMNRYLDDGAKHKPDEEQVTWLQVYLTKPWRTPAEAHRGLELPPARRGEAPEHSPTRPSLDELWAETHRRLAEGPTG